MSAAASRAPIAEALPRSRAARYASTFPVDLVISGSPSSPRIPGRLLNLSASGAAAEIVAELRPGDPVVLEFRLPGVSDLRRDDVLDVQAVVRHQGFLRCGLQFVGLTGDQQDAIQRWITSQMEEAHPLAGMSQAVGSAVRRTEILPAVWVLLAVCFSAGSLGWWHWHRSWSQLEAGASAAEARSVTPPIVVPEEDMEQLLLYRVDPVYPNGVEPGDAARVVVLDAVIGTDGSVLDLHPISGPEELSSAARDAAKLWRFRPYAVNGRALRVETTLTVTFPEN